jgi:DNA-binding CsgD family transcriptional regulator
VAHHRPQVTDFPVIARCVGARSSRDTGGPDRSGDVAVVAVRGGRGPLNQREIGRELHLSVNTVKGYTKSLYRKLDVVSRAEAVAVGRELGLC